MNNLKIVSVRSLGLQKVFDIEMPNEPNFILENGVIAHNCKAHAVSYGNIAYATAFLKHHYPLEWWTSVLKNADKNEINEKFWRHCGHLIDNPDLKLSGDHFEIQNGRIRAPLSLLHGVGKGAHAQLCKYRPYTDINDFCQKIELHKQLTGNSVIKTKKKKKTIKDPVTKEKRVEIIETQEEAFKKGHSSINRRIVYTLIISGALDSLFPKTKVVDGVDVEYTFIDQLEEFERAFKEASGAKKLTAPDTEYLSLNPLQRFQFKKGVLPAYSEDLTSLFYQMKVQGIFQRENGYYYKYNGSICRFIGPDELELLEANGMPDGEPVKVALAAYIENTRFFNYQGNKEACEVLLDVHGGRFKYTKWPKWKESNISQIYHKDLKGALGIIILNKYNTEKQSGLEDFIIIEQPKGVKEDDEKE